MNGLVLYVKILLLSTVQKSLLIKNKKSIMGYFGSQSQINNEYSINVTQVDKRLTHVIFAFAEVNSKTLKCEVLDKQWDTDMVFENQDNSSSSCTLDQMLKGNYGALFDFKKQNPNSRTILSIGGASNGQKENFTEATSTQENIEKLAKSCVEFSLDYGFDGINYDWESPSGVNEWESFKNLIVETRNLFNQYNLKKSYLSLAIMPNQLNSDLNNNTQLNYFSDINSNVDFVNLMTYDASVGSDRALNDSPLYPNKNDYGQMNINTTVYNAEKYFDINKIIVGIPLYGYKISIDSNATNKISNEDLLFQDVMNNTKCQIIGYKDIFNEYLRDENNNSYIKGWDTESKSEYLSSPNGDYLITYTGQNGMLERLNFMNELDIGGIFFWELGMSNLNNADSMLDFTFNNINADTIDYSTDGACAPYSSFCNIKSNCSYNSGDPEPKESKSVYNPLNIFTGIIALFILRLYS